MITAKSTDIGKRVILIERSWDSINCSEILHESHGVITRITEDFIWIKFDKDTYSAGVEHGEPALFWESVI